MGKKKINNNFRKNYVSLEVLKYSVTDERLSVVKVNYNQTVVNRGLQFKLNYFFLQTKC